MQRDRQDALMSCGDLLSPHLHRASGCPPRFYTLFSHPDRFTGYHVANLKDISRQITTLFLDGPGVREIEIWDLNVLIVGGDVTYGVADFYFALLL